MRLEEAKELLLNTYTLTVGVEDDRYYSVRYDEGYFILAFVQIGILPSRIVVEADWQSFYNKVPLSLKEITLWIKG